MHISNSSILLCKPFITKQVLHSCQTSFQGLMQKHLFKQKPNKLLNPVMCGLFKKERKKKRRRKKLTYTVAQRTYCTVTAVLLLFNIVNITKYCTVAAVLYNVDITRYCTVAAVLYTVDINR